MSSIAFNTIVQLRKKIKNKEISLQEVVAQTRERFERYDKTIGSALELFDSESIMRTYEGEGVVDGALNGIPGIIKDNIAQSERRLTCASKILENFVSPYDATAVARLKKNGALLVGRANMDEFAMGSSTETSAYQKTANPWDATRVSGGSSGGSIAAVAAGLVPWSLGSETGGSVRQPAAFCGIVGFKPTYGLVSRYGLVAYASSLDQIGVATRTVYDNALVLTAIAGHDAHDSTTLPSPKVDYTAMLNGALRPGLKIGIVDNALSAEGIDPEILAAIEGARTELERLGATVTRLKIPIMDYAAATYFIISRAEAASNLARFDGIRYGIRADAVTLSETYGKTRDQGFGAEVKSRILIGNYVLSVGHADQYYMNACKAQQLIRAGFQDAFKEVDLLIMPTHPIPAFKFGAFDVDKLAMDLQDYFTCAVNLAGIPAISIPCGFTKNNLPIGFQLIGPHESESLIYQTAHAYEQATDWHTKHPQGYE